VLTSLLRTAVALLSPSQCTHRTAGPAPGAESTQWGHDHDHQHEGNGGWNGGNGGGWNGGNGGGWNGGGGGHDHHHDHDHDGGWNGGNGGWNGGNGGWNGGNGGWGGGGGGWGWNDPCACAGSCMPQTLSRCALVNSGACSPRGGTACRSYFMDVFGNVKVCCSP
jgi:hypothetical protein